MEPCILNIDITFNILCLICLVMMRLYRSGITLRWYLHRCGSDLIDPDACYWKVKKNRLPSSLYESSRRPVWGIRGWKQRSKTLLGHRRQCQLQSATTRRGYVMMTSLLLLHCWMPDVHFPLLMEPHETCSEGFILDTSLLTDSRTVFRLNSPDVCGLKDSPMFVRALEPESPPKISALESKPWRTDHSRSQST